MEAAQYNLPVILGKRNRKEDIQAILKESKRVKLDDINSDGTNESDYEDGFPISHEILLQAHEKAITDIDINPSGSRMVSSGLDYSVKFWDFKTMDSNCFPFRSF